MNLEPHDELDLWQGLFLMAELLQIRTRKRELGGAGLIHTNIHLGHWYSTNR